MWLDTIRGGDPERTVVGHTNLEYHFASLALFQGILTKVTVPEIERVRRRTFLSQVAVLILCQSPDAGV